MIKRLEARGLLEAVQGSDGNRARTDNRITDAGRHALRAWLWTPTTPRAWASNRGSDAFTSRCWRPAKLG